MPFITTSVGGDGVGIQGPQGPAGQDATTGDITFDGVQIIGAGTASGDGYGLGTIELVPDGDITSDQYAIIDPTSPNHIHIRAGGTIDQSTAELILGGERNKVAVSDSYKSVSITTAAVITNIYVNAHEADSEDLIVPETSDIIVGDNIVIAGINYPVTYFSPDPNNTGFSIVRSTGVTFVAGESYIFVRDQGNNNQWTFAPDGTFEGPAMGGVKVLGLLNSGTSDLNFNANEADIYLQAASGAVTISAPEVNITSNASPSSLNINTYSGAAVNSYRTSTYAPQDRIIATLGDINNIVSNGTVRYSPIFTATGLQFTGSGETYPTYNSYYVKSGSMVSFVIEVDLSTVTNFGTGQYKLQLPFTPAFGFNHFSGWAWADPEVSPDTGTGHTIINADTSGVTDVLDLHYLKSAGGSNSPIREGLFLQGTPVTLTTISKIYVNGTYIMQELP